MKKPKPKIRLLLQPTEKEIRSLTERRSAIDPQVAETTARILDDIRKGGDSALREYSRRYDACVPHSFRVPASDVRVAGECLGRELKAAIETALCNIRRFHDYHREKEEGRIQTQSGVECFQRLVPIEKVGLYVPGGRHPLFSSLLMLGVPAVLAGCREVVVCTPPDHNGRVHPTIIYCAGLLGIRRVFCVGGAQAIAAMAYGTESIPRVDKIFGPGNDYVTAAKMQAAGDGVAVDMPAGPSELLVVADHSARADFVVADLLGQLEHGASSRAVLVSLDRQLAQAVCGELSTRLEAGEFSTVVEKNLESVVVMVAADRNQAVTILNAYAPEHLTLAVEDPQAWVGMIHNAGSVFLGHWAAEAVGDYASGTNHTLPTGGHARAWSGITVRSFQKSISFQHLSADGLLGVARTVEVMALAEGLPLHAASVSLRRAAARAEPRAKMNPLDLLSCRARSLQPYVSARDKSRAREMVWLDANELPVSFSDNAGVNRYPDPKQRHLTQRIAGMYGWEPERMLLGNGSDELIDILIRGCCDSRGDRILVCPPTYGMYEVCARGNGVDVIEVPLWPDFSLDAQGVIRHARRENARLIFLTSPNNPTGNLLDKASILDVVRNCQAAVVVDEAYLDFAKDPGLAKETEYFPNLFVLRTFSKSWGAAGVRVGMLLGNVEVLAVLRNLQAPYNISTPNSETLARILDSTKKRTRVLRELVSEREFLSNTLPLLDCVDEVFPSQANFLLVRFLDGAGVLRFLETNGVRVRDRSDQPGCGNCLRISVGTTKENRFLMECLQAYNGGLKC